MYNNDMIPKYTELPYRRGVGMMVINKDKKVFIGRRIDSKNDAWQMPQGGMDDNETIIEAAMRELREETDIKSVKILCETRNWLYYDIPEFLVDRLWDGKYRGQKQKWLLFEFLGQEDEINISKGEPEFEEWRWANLEELTDLVVSFKRHLYQSIVEEFNPVIKNLKS